MNKKWWKEGVVYQIYTRSFYDSNGDGIGDIRGIIEKLDYIESLGVDIIWLNPVYKSPDDDNGYDISDYKAISEKFGTMNDWEELLNKLHDRGIKLIMDLVVNHTSDEHEWFIESRKSKDNPYRDYYIWRPADNTGKAPNNWLSYFSGSVWEYDKDTDEYYLHLFSKKQPDLNWENDNVKNEIFDMIKWWLDKGIDGFRMDVIGFLSKHPDMPSVEVPKNSQQKYHKGEKYYANRDRTHELIQEMNQKLLSKYDIMTVGECAYISTDGALRYVEEKRHELNMVFQFEHMFLDMIDGEYWSYKPFDFIEFKKILSKWQKDLHGKGWNSQYLNNHDQPRQVSRFGNDGEYRVESAKMLATMLHTLQGTPYIYQGEEIGMTNVAFDSIDDYRDIGTLNYYNQAVGEGNSYKDIMKNIHYRSRDNARTPMQWDSTANAGFTNGNPWIKLNPNYKNINVKSALEDENSIFYYYQKLIKLRKKNDIIVYGDYKHISEGDTSIYAYIRTYDKQKLLVLLNFYENDASFVLPKDIYTDSYKLLISNYNSGDFALKTQQHLKSYEARVYILY